MHRTDLREEEEKRDKEKEECQRGKNTAKRRSTKRGFLGRFGTTSKEKRQPTSRLKHKESLRQGTTDKVTSFFSFLHREDHRRESGGEPMSTNNQVYNGRSWESMSLYLRLFSPSDLKRLAADFNSSNLTGLAGLEGSASCLIILYRAMAAG